MPSILFVTTFGRVPYENLMPFATLPIWVSRLLGRAKEALENLDDMLIVASTPDRFNCTARVSLKRAGLPDPVKWPKQLNRRQTHANRPNAKFFGFAYS